MKIDRLEYLRREESRLWDRVEPAVIARQLLGVRPDADTGLKLYEIGLLRQEIRELEKVKFIENRVWSKQPSEHRVIP